jgi:deoxyribonuclease-4
VEGWAGRTAYRDLLNTSVETITNSAIISMTLGAALREAYRIGFHAPKAKSLAGTVLSLGDYSKPYQIFLGGPQTTKMTIPDAELALTAKAVADTGARVYVHSQYIINLCHDAGAAPDGGNWNVDLLRKNLQYAGAAGFRGVVVHVGKSTTRPLPDALNTMRTAVQAVLDAATPECPLLLETPAGQGTETLTDANEFIDFVSDFADPRFRICLDTCHVFACGHEPIRYLQKLKGRGDLLRLVHYNDSAEPCGSCLDRHAMVGTGHIGIEKMTEVAKFCSAEGVPMVIE